MRQKRKVVLLTSAILLSSASFVFASLAIFSSPELPTRLQPSSDQLLKPIAEPALEIPREHTQKIGPKHFLDYNAWRHIQASA